MLVCDKCGAGINEGAKFCPQCGDPVTDADRVTALVAEQQVANVVISFGQSSSPNFNKAVEICKNIPSYSVSGEGKQTQHKISLPITEVDLLINLFDLVGSWKTSQMLINGHSATKKDLTYYGVGCYRNRQKAFKPEQYCFGEKEYSANIWGCMRLQMPITEWGGGWLDYGEFDKSGTWYFDKERIKHELELNLKENELCPVLNRKRVLETLDKLPDSINPREDKNWQYRTSYQEIGGGFKEVAVGIKPLMKKANRYVMGEFKPSWESHEPTYSGDDDRAIQINSELGKEVPEKHIVPKEQSKNISLGVLVWAIIAMILLYFIFR